MISFRVNNDKVLFWEISVCARAFAHASVIVCVCV